MDYLNKNSKRLAKLIVNKSGGTAAEGARTYRVTLPNEWVRLIGLGDENRECEISLEGGGIFIKPKELETHDIVRITVYENDTLLSVITADYTNKCVWTSDHTDDILRKPFGNSLPTWEVYEDYLESRCMPRTRAGLKDYLDQIGVYEYEPLEIIRKTGGRMAEDYIRLEVDG